jgi:hypothetical protein
VERKVKYIGDILSRGIGMHAIHTISLYAIVYASSGHSTFTAMRAEW